MADNSQRMSYRVGEAKGQAQEKGNQLVDKASNLAQSAKDSVQQAGQTVMTKAQGTADAGDNWMEQELSKGMCIHHLIRIVS